MHGWRALNTGLVDCGGGEASFAVFCSTLPPCNHHPACTAGEGGWRKPVKLTWGGGAVMYDSHHLGSCVWHRMKHVSGLGTCGSYRLPSLTLGTKGDRDIMETRFIENLNQSLNKVGQHERHTWEGTASKRSYDSHFQIGTLITEGVKGLAKPRKDELPVPRLVLPTPGSMEDWPGTLV